MPEGLVRVLIIGLPEADDDERELNRDWEHEVRATESDTEQIVLATNARAKEQRTLEWRPMQWAMHDPIAQEYGFRFLAAPFALFEELTTEATLTRASRMIDGVVIPDCPDDAIVYSVDMIRSQLQWEAAAGKS